MLAGMFTDGGKTLRVKKVFSKNLHPPHPPHPSKLSEGRSSFGRRCTFEKSFLHRFCTRRTRLGCFGDDPDAPCLARGGLWAPWRPGAWGL